jgi:hypothetical protein
MPPSTRSVVSRSVPANPSPHVHRFEQIARLVADRLQRRFRDLVRTGAARQAEHRAARIGVPVRRAEADEGRHQIDVLLRIGLFRHLARLRGIVDDAEPVAQPLHRSAGHEDRAFQRIGRLAAEPVGDGGQHAVLRGDPVGAGIEQRETAGAVGRFEHARLETGLADGRRLLVARDAADRDFRAQDIRLRRAEIGGAIEHLRQDRAGDVQDLQQIVVPAILGDVVDQRARRIGRVGDMARAAGQPPDQECVDGAEGDLARLGARPQPCRHCRAARRSWCRKNTGRAAGRFSP